MLVRLLLLLLAAVTATGFELFPSKLKLYTNETRFTRTRPACFPSL